MTPRTKEQNEEIRLRRLAQIRRAAADVFLDKGMMLEIRDVAAAAGLGYGTVYHYYSNKGDLLHDVLWTAMDRAGEWLVAGDAGDPLVAAGVRLLELWAEDHGVYLLYKLAAEEFRLLPEARAVPLAEAFRREALLPFAVWLGSSPPLWGVPPASAEDAAVGNGGDPAPHVRQAEWLLAALAGCAFFPLRRGSLRAEAGEIAGLLLHRLSDRIGLTIEGVEAT